MLYTWDINIPKNTTEANPVEQTLQLDYGVIDWVSVTFPPGSAKLTHLQIFRFGHMIFPSSPGMDLRGDTFPIAWREYYEMFQRPHELIAKCWNEDDTYPHKVYIAMAVLPRKAIIALAIVDAFKRIFRVFGIK